MDLDSAGQEIPDKLLAIRISLQSRKFSLSRNMRIDNSECHAISTQCRTLWLCHFFYPKGHTFSACLPRFPPKGISWLNF